MTGSCVCRETTNASPQVEPAAIITTWNSLRAPEQPRVDEEERTTKQHTNCTRVTPRERSKPKMNWQSQKRLLRRERLGCGVHQRECIVCVVALVRGEVRAGALARRTPPNWDGDLDSALGKSFTTRPILSLSLSKSKRMPGLGKSADVLVGSQRVSVTVR